MDTLNTAPTSHGGLIFPLDMFRPTVLAAVIAELLVGKVRNILDATLEIARHPTSPLALARIRGSVVGDDAAEFWRTNPDIALAASQVVPRQCFVYYARAGEQRREGFLVAQRGQAIAADATEKAAEQQELLARSESVAKGLRYVEDARGVVVFVPAELADTEVLRHYVVPVVENALPDGLPRALLGKLQGKAIDFAVKVEFFSEVFLANQPLNRPKFDEKAAEVDLGGTRVKALEVHAPRLGAGTLLRLGGKNVFVSRKLDQALPAELLLPALQG